MENRRPIKIALGHQARVGKDTFADYLVANYNFKQVSFAQSLYGVCGEIQSYLGKPLVKVPKLLQGVGLLLREVYGEDIWLNLALKKIPNGENIVISDMRFKNEFAALKELGFTTIKLVRPDRPIDRDPNHPSEIELIDYNFDYTVVNDGSIQEFNTKIDNIIKNISLSMS